jgi:protein-S-isoprenylcysteine O-methyltransferase Ste14
MSRRTISYAMTGCIVALAAAVIYAVVRLFVLSQRVDASIFVINVVVFAGIAGFMIYLTKKERDLKEKEFFSD